MNIVPPDESELMQRFREGDARAFEQVYHQFSAALCYFANGIVKNIEEARDRVAEAYYKLWKRHTAFETLLNVKAFLYITTRNECLNFLRDEKQRVIYDIEQKDFPVESFIVQMAEAELLNEIFQQMESLPEKHLQLMRLRYIHGLSYREIAIRLNMQEANVRMAHSRSIKMLRELLQRRNTFIVIIYISTKEILYLEFLGHLPTLVNCVLIIHHLS
jgi:RNA polymerase sigma factor, sigma-70 family